MLNINVDVHFKQTFVDSKRYSYYQLMQRIIIEIIQMPHLNVKRNF